MKWTNKAPRPEQPEWYWMRTDPNSRPKVLLVYLTRYGYAAGADKIATLLREFPEMQWSDQPILMPMNQDALTKRCVELINENRELKNWQRAFIEIGHAMHIENAEQWQSPEIAKAAILRRSREQQDEIAAQNKEIQRLRETIQKQEDKINRLCIVAYYHKDDTFAVKADFRCSLMALKSHKLEMLKVMQGSLWDQLCKAVGAPDRTPMP